MSDEKIIIHDNLQVWIESEAADLANTPANALANTPVKASQTHWLELESATTHF